MVLTDRESRRGLTRREIERERGPASWLALERDPASIRFGNSQDGRETQSVPGIWTFGREEQVEDLLANRRIDSGSGVLHTESDPTSGSERAAHNCDRSR